MVSAYEAVANNQEYKEVREYVHRPMDFWNKLKADLATARIAFHMTTIHDVGFKTPMCSKNGRTHLLCYAKGRDNVVIFCSHFHFNVVIFFLSHFLQGEDTTDLKYFR